MKIFGGQGFGKSRRYRFTHLNSSGILACPPKFQRNLSGRGKEFRKRGRHKSKRNMIPKENNFAYIDGANLYKGIESSGWHLDYHRFRVWLSEKYSVKRAYIFLGLIPRYKELYKYLQEAGFVLVFKEVVYDDLGEPKGNCDVNLALQAACDAYENKFDRAVLVSSDGDYASLVKFLLEREKFSIILSTHPKDKCSILLKRTGARISYINEQRSHLEVSQKEKAPDRDGTP